MGEKTNKANAKRRRNKKQDTDDFEERQQRIAEAAYFRAERRGFTPGREQDDWLEAEIEINAEPEER